MNSSQNTENYDNFIYLIQFHKLFINYSIVNNTGIVYSVICLCSMKISKCYFGYLSGIKLTDLSIVEQVTKVSSKG